MKRVGAAWKTVDGYSLVLNVTKLNELPKTAEGDVRVKLVTNSYKQTDKHPDLIALAKVIQTAVNTEQQSLSHSEFQTKNNRENIEQNNTKQEKNYGNLPNFVNSLSFGTEVPF